MRIFEEYDLDDNFRRFCDTIAEIVVERRSEWRQHAACRGLDVSMFYAERGDHQTYEAAKDVCAQCSVVDECAEHARDNSLRTGIWGGKSAERLRQNRKRCLYCGIPFNAQNGNERICSDECRKASNTASKRAERQRKGLAPSKVAS